MNETTSNIQEQTQEKKTIDKDYNFRIMEQKLAMERQARLDAEEALKKAISMKSTQNIEEDDDDTDAYVDKKKLTKTLNKYGEQAKQQTQTEINRAVKEALDEERRQTWLNQNPDFYDILQNHTEKFASEHKQLADTILKMPDNFERQKLVYDTIKAMGFHQDKLKESSIQNKIDANKHVPFYQPGGVASAPYNTNMGDFSQQGQKNAYEKMKELQARVGYGR